MFAFMVKRESLSLEFSDEDNCKTKKLSFLIEKDDESSASSFVVQLFNYLMTAEKGFLA